MENQLGKRIEIIRESERLELEEFMPILESTKTSYYNWIDGKNYPNSKVIINILTKFPQYRAEWLLLGTGEMKKGGSKSEEVNEPHENYSNTTVIRKEIKKVLREMLNNTD